jgi:hypothetical protein
MEMRKKITAAALGICILASTSGVVFAEEDKPTADLTVAALSKYVWRGQEFSKDSVVIQPSMTVGYKGFSANLWGNLDTDLYDTTSESSNWTETDLTLSYDRSFGAVGVTAGYIFYGLDGANDSQEIFVSASLDTLLAPTLSVYRDYDNYAGWYVTLGVSHSFPITADLNLDLGAQVGYLEADEASTYGEVISGAESETEAYSALHDGTLSASMSFPVNEYISVTPSLTYVFPLSSEASDLMELRSKNGTDDSFLYGGVSFSMAF